MYNIPNQAVKLINALKENNFDAYLVGGAVRDLLLGKIPNDYDIATSATPEDAIAVAKEQGWRTIDRLGKNFGTIIIIVGAMEFEVTTFRGERYDRDSHRPAEIWKAKNLQEDCRRRDFTVNAMAMDLNGVVYDFHNGRQDLQNGRLRTVGDARQRFSEDALRMFRACRFVADLGFAYEESKLPAHTFGAGNTAYYLSKCPVFDVSRCGGLSMERIRAELEKMLVADYAGRGFAMLVGSGLSEAKCQIKRNGEVSTIDVLPELRHLVGLKQNPKFHGFDAWEHTLTALDAAPEKLTVRWALLLHDLGKGMPGVRTLNKEGQPRDAGHEAVSAKMAEAVLKRLNYAPKLVRYITFLVANHMIFAGFMRVAHGKLENSTDGLVVRSFASVEEQYREVEAAMLRWLRKVVSQNLFKHESDLADACADLVKVYLADMGATNAGKQRAIMDEGRELGARLVQLARTKMPISTGDLQFNTTDIGQIPAQVNVKNALTYLVKRVQAGELPNEHNALMRALLAKYQRPERKSHVQKNRSGHHGSRRRHKRPVAAAEAGCNAADSSQQQ